MSVHLKSLHNHCNALYFRVNEVVDMGRPDADPEGTLVLEPSAPQTTQAELMKFVDADYFGYRDEDDGIILGLEQDADTKGKYIVYFAKINRRPIFRDNAM